MRLSQRPRRGALFTGGPFGAVPFSAAPFTAVLLGACLALSGCGGSSGSGTPASAHQPAAESGAFPVSLKSKFGTATVKKAPRRVVALGWSDQDAALALGVKPVAVVKTESSFRHGVGPWAQKKLGSSRPKVLDTTDGYPAEKIAALHPDLILGVQSGLNSSDYAKLSHIAPTVAYPAGHTTYGTPWPQQTELIGKALGHPAKARKLVGTVRAGLKADRRKYPHLVGKSFVYAFPQPSQGRLMLYTDDRTKVLREAGMKLDPVVNKGSKSMSFARALSMERLDEVRSDATLLWYNSAQDRKKLEADPVFKKLPSVRSGAYVPVGRALAQATSAPSVLSIPWSMHTLLPKLDKALR